ncbi:hypothetical protein CALVIDRAFT_533864 [Calocera viscosa TUFC12733]|uniref:Uncharacterized protein n=1 Tax=Calocera viscosa (strain TUFC12733) TaxID=1330018 RepID=A0A167QTM3_CALVF|nr:hypothetical protein CALVIDRAFT_533864 [Calocera viscosa TUFC12733]
MTCSAWMFLLLLKFGLWWPGAGRRDTAQNRRSSYLCPGAWEGDPPPEFRAITATRPASPAVDCSYLA